MRESGIILTLQGEAEYRAGLDSVARATKQMGLETQLAVARLGHNAGITDTYNTRMRGLSKQLDVASDRTRVLQRRQSELPGVQEKIATSMDATNKSLLAQTLQTELLQEKYDGLTNYQKYNSEAGKALRAELQASKTSTSELSKEYDRLSKIYNENSVELKNLDNQILQSQLNTQNLINMKQKEHEVWRESGGRYADAVASLDKTGKAVYNFGDRASEMGGLLTRGVTVPILAVGAGAVKAASDWETAWVGVEKTNEGTVEQMDALQTGLRDMAITTPLAQKELAAIAESAGQLGIEMNDGAEYVLGFTKVMADMAVSTDLTSEQAATYMARLANITQMSQGDFERLGSTVVDLGNNFAATESEILLMSTRLARYGQQVGMTEEEIVGMSAAMASVGIRAEEGGSAMGRVLSDINTAVLSTSEELEGMAKIAGMSAEEFAKAWKTSSADAMNEFVLGLKRIQDGGGDATAALKDLGISSTNEVSTLLALAGAGDILTESLKMSGEAWKDNSALSEEAAKAYDTFANKLVLFKNKIVDIAIDLGEPIIEALTGFIDSAEPWIEKAKEMVNAFIEMDAEGQRNVVMWAAIAAAAGPVIGVIGGVSQALGLAIQSVGGLIKIYGKLTTPKAITDTVTELGKIPGAATQAGGAAALFSNPWTGSVAIIAGAVASIGLLIKSDLDAPHKAHQESVKETKGAYQDWFDAVTSGASAAVDAQTNLQNATEQSGESYREMANRIMNQNKVIQDNIDTVFQGGFYDAAWAYNLSGYGQGLTSYDSLSKQLSGMMPDSQIKDIESSFNNFAVIMGNSLADIGNSFKEQSVVTSTWAKGQVDGLATVSQAVLDNLGAQKERLLEQAQDEAEYNRNSKQWLQERTAEIEKEYNRQVDVVQRAQDTVYSILSNASANNRALTSQEMVSITRSVMDMAKISGKSLSDLAKAGEITGEALRAMATDTGLAFMEAEGMIDKSTADMVRSITNPEERVKAFMEALEEYDQIKPDKKYLEVETEEAKADLLELTELANKWNELTFEERLAQVETRGKEEIDELLTLLGVDWESLTPTQKEYYAQAEGGEALENILYLTEEWNRQTDPQKKFAVLETQIDSEALLGAIKARDLWNDADFMSLAMEIDTNAPDAHEQIVNLINYFSEQQGLPPLQMETEALTEESQQKLAELIATYTGAPVDEVAEFLTSTNADETTSSIEGTGQALTDLGGRTATVTVNAIDNASGIIGSVGRGLSGLDGRTATTYINTVTSRRDAYATGGHIDAYAEGGNIKWGGMFASGGNVPKGYQGIVGEKGAELFTVTERGVTITPLSPGEKMDGVRGSIRKEVAEQLGDRGGGINLTVNIDKPVVSNKEDINSLTNQIVRKASQMLAQQAKNKQKGRPAW